MILTDLRGELASSLIALRKTAPDTVSGRFLSVPGHFMWLRAEIDNPLRDGGSYLMEINIGNPRHTATAVGPDILDDPNLRFLVQRRAPRSQSIYRIDCHGRDVVEVNAGQSRAHLDTAPLGDGLHEVTEIGPDCAWKCVDSTIDLWNHLGRPVRERFGLTATADGTHILWLDQPGTNHAWLLPNP